MNNILSINDLTVHYITRDLGISKAVNNFSLNIKAGETVGLVGETGAGKTTVALSIMRLIQNPPGKIIGGEILFKDNDLTKLSDNAMRHIRGKEISMIFQDPMTALNPIETIGNQIAEVVSLHHKTSKKEAIIKACEMLEIVGIPSDRFNEYPHQFSGGMKQRVVIAIALACSPQLLLADEPTTALDVTIQAQVLALINKLKNDMNTSVLLITHDLGVVAEMCDHVATMYAGRILEFGTAYHIFKEAGHPYTKGLFNSLPTKSTQEKRLKPIKGLMPDPANLPDFCAFEPRCEYKNVQCQSAENDLLEISDGHFVRCLLCRKE